MKTFKILLQSTGLSLREASRYLDVSYDSIKAWLYGKYNCPGGVILEMAVLCNKQGAAADAVLDLIEENPDAQDVEIGYCADDHEAQGLGWPTKTAHDAVIRRVIEGCDDLLAIKLVPRGSTTASAAAEINA